MPTRYARRGLHALAGQRIDTQVNPQLPHPVLQFCLPASAGDLKAIADANAERTTLDRLVARCGAVVGRGACGHPDGVVHLVRSALAVFSSDFDRHLSGEPCAESVRASVLTGLPSTSERSL